MNMRHTIWTLIFSVFVTTSAFAAEVYPRVEERARMLNELQLVTEQPLQLDFKGQVGAREQAFLNIFQKEFWPVQAKTSAMGEKIVILSIAYDRGLFNDDAEANAWMKQKEEIGHALNEIGTSPQWKDVIKRLADAAGDMPGELPEFARELFKNEQRSSFSKAELPLLNKMNRLENKIRKIANKNPYTRSLASSARKAIELEKRFQAGKLSFTDAATKLEALRPISKTAMGQYIALKARPYLEEIAIIRTQLARSKGYANWAEFTLAGEADNYADGYKTPAERITFLKDLLSSTRETHRRFLLQRANDIPGVRVNVKTDLSDLTDSESRLFSMPGESIISEYFPVENVEAFWKKTMLESGFTKTVVDRIQLDNYPRSGKQTHAYMWPVRIQSPKTFIIDARTMTAKKPRQLPRTWTPALIYIVQNMLTDGHDSYATAFHEGGHGLDFSHRQDLLTGGQSSSYDETHSTMMEKFFKDRDFLLASGVNRAGEKIPAEKVDQFITNSHLNALNEMRGTAFSSLFDLEIWNHAYEKGGEDYVSRSVRLEGELHDRYLFSKQTIGSDGIDTRYGVFRTDHFYSGQTQYIGYLYAEIAADMSYRHLLDVFEKQTGRRTVLNQPALANILIDGYYKTGFTEEFPTSIETFTGAKFVPTEATAAIVAPVNAWLERRQTRTCGSVFATIH